MRRSAVAALTGLVLAVGVGVSIAQQSEPSFAPVPPGKNYGRMHFETKLGSFRVINGEGQLQMTFKGTVLVSQHQDGVLNVTGNVRKEIDERGRKVYFGQGRLAITGRWRAIQWFGRDMSADWLGAGMVQLKGEFDKDLNTGTFWVDDPKQIQYWQTSLITVLLPNPAGQDSQEPIERSAAPDQGR
ncbi:MAG: hypothetical protein WHU10_05685 [Fimbriimonadales bacterium]